MQPCPHIQSIQQSIMHLTVTDMNCIYSTDSRSPDAVSVPSVESLVPDWSRETPADKARGSKGPQRRTGRQDPQGACMAHPPSHQTQETLGLPNNDGVAGRGKHRASPYMQSDDCGMTSSSVRGVRERVSFDLSRGTWLSLIDCL